VIVLDVQRHPGALGDATKDYVEAMSSSVRFLVAENEHMTKELQATKQREEQSIGSAKSKMNMAILSKVLALETIMWRLYDTFITMHKVVVYVHGDQ